MRLMTSTFLAFCTACAAMAQSAPDVVNVTAILPDSLEFEASPALEAIEDHSVVLLDLTMSVEAYPSFENEDGTYSMLEGDCEFGPMEGVRMVSIPTGSNHLVMYVRPGDPARFAANGVSVRGCYLANAHSIPTAGLVMLNPLPASACGLTQ